MIIRTPCQTCTGMGNVLSIKCYLVLMKYVGEEIYHIIPNRKPFMILDTLVVEDNHAVSELFLKSEEWFFQCHYPGNPILPLTLLVESMTQTFSATFLPKAEDKTEIPVISSLGEIRLKEGSKPGDILRIEATLQSFKRGIAKGNCKAFKNGGENPILEFEIVDVLPSQMIRIK